MLAVDPVKIIIGPVMLRKTDPLRIQSDLTRLRETVLTKDKMTIGMIRMIEIMLSLIISSKIIFYSSLVNL